MLTCMEHSSSGKASTVEEINAKQPNKTFSSQIKDMVLKASGAYRHCTPCANQQVEQQKRNHNFSGGEPDKSGRRNLYRRAWSSSSGRKELEARLWVISTGEGTPASASGRLADTVVFVEESEPKEWVAQVEPGVLITFLSLPKGGNDLKRVQFSQEMFNKWQAHRWWTENCEKVMELYNVQRLNRQSFPLPTTPRSQDDMISSNTRACTDSPSTSSLLREQKPHTPDRPNGMVNGYLSDSLDHGYEHSRAHNDSNGVATTPKLSSTSGVKTEISSMDASTRTRRSFRDADRSGEISLNNGNYLDTEWVQQDEPGVYLTIRSLPDGRKELRRVRFSREKFQETHARLWWEKNRVRINKQYL
ncbi:protein Brevis radix-like 4 [Primulina huaijiensis]|uniref:protein Brevis radix-like 4 n=1 Tax=Primulina huaijiensis TaxID=1492673 RepID=UPI003CC76FD9